MNDTTPKCCENCPHLERTGSCNLYRQCGPWRTWFRKEWAMIQKATKLLQEETEKEAKP